MKVFDFTSGAKGSQIGTRPRTQWAGGAVVEKNGKSFLVSLAGFPDGWTWHVCAGFGNPDIGDVGITPEEFGVEAVCFCHGELALGLDDNDKEITEWTWQVVGTPAWNKKACQNGILKFEKLRN